MSYSSNRLWEVSDFIESPIKEIHAVKINGEITSIIIAVEGKELIIRGGKLDVFCHEQGEDFNVRITE